MSDKDKLSKIVPLEQRQPHGKPSEQPSLWAAPCRDVLSQVSPQEVGQA